MKNKKIIIFSLVILILSAIIFFEADLCLAASEATKEVKLSNPLEVSANPSQIIGLIIKSALGVIGGLALVMMVWGGFQWLTSAGNPQKVKKGSSTMIWAIIGLILALGSYVLVNTILNFLAGRQTG